MSFRWWFRPPRHLLALFLAVTMVPATALAWLSWRLLEQDRALATQRLQERLEHTADLIAAALERRLAEIEEELPAWAAAPAADDLDDALIVAFSPQGVEAHPASGLLYHPFVLPATEPPSHVFMAGEIIEFQQQDFPRAIATFRELARSEDPLIQAGALVRLARNLRKNSQHEEALAAYEELAGLGSVPVGGVPAELLARHARCTTLEELKRSSQLQGVASALYADLQSGRWRLDRISYSFHAEEAQRWLADGPDAQAEPQDALAFSAAVEALWDQWQESRRAQEDTRGRRSTWVHGRSVLVVWRGSADSLVALVAGPRHLESRWRGIWEDHGVVVALTDTGGHPALGQPAGAVEQQAVRPAADTRLPWTLRVASASPTAELAQLAGRRPLLLAGLAMMALLVLGGGYFVARAVTRELAVARLQADFVSAVSHEFRTPLTSMRHLTELLDTEIVTSDERRRQYYSTLRRETERLHRLVESLLNFRRMEAGAFEYRFDPLDPGELVKGVVAEFQQEMATHDHRVELHVDGSLPPVRADREALGRALWNLLDNAVKYSPQSPTIRVELAREGESVAMRVRDRGVGIPVAEQKEIFQKFVRGSASAASHVRGAGIGLAMVQHIVQAHGGDVRLASAPGRGSTFTLLLPATEGAR